MILRSGLLASAMLFASVAGVLAHALPGSVLLLRQEGTEVQLTIQFPVEDLVIAAPDLAVLAELAPGDVLAQETADLLARYLGDHLSMTEDGTPLRLTLAKARIQPAYHDHLGHFSLVVSDWTATRSGSDPTSLKLTYDAVMHEVRNHRATVQWLDANGSAQPMADFGYLGAADGVSLNQGAAGRD